MLEIYEMPGHLIRRLNQMAVSLFKEQASAAGFDLTPVQYGALSSINDTPALDQATLALNIAYDRATIGGVVDRLAQKGLVHREVSSEDRRARKLYLTPTGEETLKKLTPIVRHIQSTLLEGLDPAEQKIFVKLLKKATNASGK